MFPGWRFGSVDFVEILVEKDANINVILHEDKLIDSIVFGNLGMTKFLIQEGLRVSSSVYFTLRSIIAVENDNVLSCITK